MALNTKYTSDTPCLTHREVELFLDQKRYDDFVVIFKKKDGSIRKMFCRRLGTHRIPWTWWCAARQEYIQSWAPECINPWCNGKTTCVVSLRPMDSSSWGDEVPDKLFGSFNIHNVIAIDTIENWTENWGQFANEGGAEQETDEEETLNPSYKYLSLSSIWMQ